MMPAKPHQASLSAPTLLKRTVVQLRVLCQQQGIHGISKLNKAQLVQKIMEANPCAPPVPAAPLPPSSPPVSSATLFPTLNQTSPSPSANTSAEPHSSFKSGASIKSGTSSAVLAIALGDVTAVDTRTHAVAHTFVGTSEVPLPTPAPKHLETNSDDRLARLRQSNSTWKDELRGFHSDLRHSPEPEGSSSPNSLAANASLHTASSSLQPMRIGDQSSTTVGMPKRAASGPSSTGRVAPAKRHNMTPFARRSTLLRPLKFVSPKPRFQTAPRHKSSAGPVAPSPIYGLTPLIADQHGRGTLTNRVQYIKSHFVNHLFVNLNAARQIPILNPPFPSQGMDGLAFNGFGPNVYQLDNDVFQVALRWWIGRAHTMLQLGSGQEWSTNASTTGLLGPDFAKWPPVVAAKKVAGDIFVVHTEERVTGRPSETLLGKSKTQRKTAQTTTHSYLVIGATGDAIGATPRLSNSNPESFLVVEECAVRPDWFAYIKSLDGGGEGRDRNDSSTADQSMKQTEDQQLSLLTHVKTKDSWAVSGGISNAWRARAEQKAQGSSCRELEVAERAVLASCALNSFSGEKLDAFQMDTAWLGNRPDLNAKPKNAVELYLPECHQVLSVHLPPPPSHPALAIVHRASGKSDFVLSDTGHVVGDEDAGVAELWQGILGCDYKGHEVKHVSAFWAGWEDRMVGELE